jgi:predicted CoA-binding protein
VSETSAIPPAALLDERAQIRWVLQHCQTVAVVGLSSNRYKDSHIVAHHLSRHQYDVVPINPTATEVLGRPAYPSLATLPTDLASLVDLVLIFRPSAEVPGIVEAALAHLPRLRAIWTQKGIVHDGAAARAQGRGVVVVQDRCIRTQHLFARFGEATSPREP